jgi:hypothetical protein
MSSVLEASAREVYEAYNEALLRQDWLSARFWRPIVIERLEILSGSVKHRDGSASTHRADKEG